MRRFRLPLTHFLIVIGSATLLCAQVNFTLFVGEDNQESSTTGVVAADFDNDGIPDVVTADLAGFLTFYKGLGGGNFVRRRFTHLQGLGRLATADFNGDGVPDIAVIASLGGVLRGQVAVMISNQDGTFRQGVNIDVGSTLQFITLADFNGDHLPDVAVSGCGSNGFCTAQVFLNQGDGTFQLASTLPDGGGQIVAGDFNADGHQDLAVISGNEVAVFLGDGNGGFDSPILASLTNVSSIAVGDFFNNRVQSLVALVISPVSSTESSTSLFALRLSGRHLRVENQQLLQDHTTTPFLEVTGGDLNGDFLEDVFLVGSGDRGMSPISAYMLGNGDGTFQSPVTAPSLSVPVFLGTRQLSPFIRDMDGDSRHDVGMAWGGTTTGTGGPEVLHNINATTNCSLPPANVLAVHICAPADGQVVDRIFTFQGSGNAFNGIAKRMELWIDGKKVAENLEDQLNATIRLKHGEHVATFVVVDSFDNRASESVNFAVSRKQ